ncbi:MAG: GNAT family N-acetyltransferase [Theionarchaea archaeon]|nr:GNAT family N-acetyltransferase [Theionarchaea archaeon]
MEELMIVSKPLDTTTIYDLFSPCRACVYWEAPEQQGLIREEEAFALKKAWVQTTLKTFSTCGRLLYEGGIPVAYAQCCLPRFLKGVEEYTSLTPVSPDAVFISCLYVAETYRARGLGTYLLNEVISQVKGQGWKALETYSRDDSPNNCSGPTTFYVKNGFSVFKREEWEGTVFSLVRRQF